MLGLRNLKVSNIFCIYLLIVLVCTTSRLSFNRKNGFHFTSINQAYVNGFDGFSNGWNGTNITSLIDEAKKTQLNKMKSDEQIFWLVENRSTIMDIQYSWKNKPEDPKQFYFF